MSSVSVIVPTYCGAACLAELVDRVAAVLAGRADPFEIILVEDCGPDHGKTWAEVVRLAAEHDFVRGFRMMRNRGQHNALLLGIREARYELCLTMDDDLQNPPEEIPKLLAAIEEPSGETLDVVYGSPQKKRHGFMQNLGSLVVRLALAAVLKARYARYASAFRVFRTRIRDAFARYSGSTISIDALLGWGTERFGHVMVDHHPRAQGSSAYTFVKMLSHAITMITSFSTLPLRIASLVGFFFFLFGGGVLTYTLWVWATGSPVAGWTFIVSFMGIMTGAQLLTLGVFGEYQARIYTQTQGHPPYTVAEATGEDDGPPR